MMIRDWNSWLNDARNIPEIPCCNISHDAIFISDVCDDEMDSCCMFLSRIIMFLYAYVSLCWLWKIDDKYVNENYDLWEIAIASKRMRFISC